MRYALMGILAIALSIASTGCAEQKPISTNKDFEQKDGPSKGKTMTSTMEDPNYKKK